jgi:uncharacterized protein HemX
VKKLTAMLFTLLVAVAMTMPAFAAGQSQGETPSTQDQTTQTQTTTKKHKKTKKHKSRKHHKGSSSTPTTPPPQ